MNMHQLGGVSAGAMGKCIEQQCEPQRPAQVAEAMDQLDRSRAILEDAVAKLLSKLTMVVREEPGKPAPDSCNKAIQQFVPLADFIRTQSYALDNIRERVCSVIDRIELP